MLPHSAAADSCTELWNPVEAAKAMVPLSGVLADFMFSAIVIIITVNRPNNKGQAEAHYALRLQVVALLAAVVAASASINIAGEGVCLRARTEWVLSAGLLWMGVALSSDVFSLTSADPAVFEMDENEGGADEVAGSAGAESDVFEGGPAFGEEGESAFAEAA